MPYPIGDINQDGVVNTFDLSLLLAAWGSDDSAADLNNDGVVNAFDLSLLLGNWGATGGEEGEPIPTVMTDTINQYGITVTLDQPRPVGQYINGDYFVVGPATIVNIDPAWDTSVTIDSVQLGVHGAQVDPMPGPQGYFWGSGYDDDLNVANKLPITINPTGGPRSFIATRGVNDGDTSGTTQPFWNGSTHRFRPNIRDAIAVTVVAQAPKVGSFRPSFGGGIKVERNRSEINDSLIPRVDHSDVSVSIQDPASRLSNVRGPWLACQRAGTWQKQNFGPHNNAQSYGVDFASNVHASILVLLLDFPPEQKEELLIRVVQGAIDIYGMLLNGADYVTNGNDQSLGGHMSGHKWPVIFAGILFDDPVMKNIRNLRVHPDTWSGAIFQEDEQVYWHTGADANCPRPIGAGTWKENNKAPLTERGWSNAYRRCCTANVWQSAALGAYIMDAVELWDHDPFFEYLDYYMHEDPTVEHGSNNRGRPNWSQYVWDAIRPQYGQPYKTPHKPE